MQSQIRKIKKMAKAKPTMEGAGVHLHRAFGFQDTDSYDPFLLLDDFRGDNPDDYLAGFPWHPHRGIETITYMLAGSVEHGDSLGNSGVIEAGGVQWMTAGSGIIHQEMPKPGPGGRMYGFQLWANLAASEKMTQPRYQEFAADQIPSATGPEGASAKVICGYLWDTAGPVHGIGINPVYADMYIPPGVNLTLPIAAERSAFAYVYEGSVCFSDERDPFSHPTEAERWHDTQPPAEAENRTLVLFDQGRQIKLSSGEQGARFLFVSGVPLREPVAWYGPIVMNTRQELKQAFAELDQGTFLQQGPTRPADPYNPAGPAGRPGQ